MGKQVTVDCDDLELIVMATGIAKQMEKMLEAHRHDPFVCKDDEMIAKAHNRLAIAIVRAKRGIPHPEYDEPLSLAAINLLKNINNTLNDLNRFPVCRVDPQWMRPNGSPPAGFLELRTKGMIEIGSVFEYILWQSEPTETRFDKGEFRIRITDRGYNAIFSIEEKVVLAIQ